MWARSDPGAIRSFFFFFFPPPPSLHFPFKLKEDRENSLVRRETLFSLFSPSPFPLLPFPAGASPPPSSFRGSGSVGGEVEVKEVKMRAAAEHFPPFFFFWWLGVFFFFLPPLLRQLADQEKTLSVFRSAGPFPSLPFPPLPFPWLFSSLGGNVAMENPRKENDDGLALSLFPFFFPPPLFSFPPLPPSQTFFCLVRKNLLKNPGESARPPLFPLFFFFFFLF